MRLRDIGGIIVVDFIDMHNQEKNRILYQHLKDCMKSDKAQHKILPPSHFSLVEITRERVRPQIVLDTTEVCYACGGTGKSTSSLLIVDEINRKLHWLMREKKPTNVHLVVHPFIAAFLTRGWYSQRLQWCWQYKKNIHIRENHAFSLGVFQFQDQLGKEL